MTTTVSTVLPPDEREAPASAAVPPYETPVDLQADLLDWVRVLVRRLVLRQPPAARPTPDGLSSITVRHEEMAVWLRGDEAPPDGELAQAGAEAGQGWIRLQARLERSAREGVDLPLERLRGFFGLADDEVRVVAALFAPEVDDGVLRAYRYAWNDFTRKQVEIGFLLDLLGATAAERDGLRRRLAPLERLRRHQLLSLGPEVRDDEEVPFSARSVRLANRVVDFLRGDDRLDESLLGLCEYIEPACTLEELLVPEGVQEQIRFSLVERRRGRSGPVLLEGPSGVGKRSLVEALAGELAQPFVVADLDAIFEDPRPTGELLATVLREAALVGGIAYFAAGAALPDEVTRPQAARLATVLGGAPGALFIGLTVRPPWLSRALPGAPRVRVPVPTTEVREALWRRTIARGVRLSSSVDLAELAQRYALTGGAVIEAARAAIVRARRRSARHPTVTQDALETCARAQLLHRLGTLAHRIPPRFAWPDLILPDDEMRRLREIVAFARNRRQVFEEWGFDAKVPYGRGLSALFSGPPGTGKTMAAGIIAHELSLELFKVDLSRIVDRYIGETEKNLARVFDEATESSSILLFDEADSLFSKRTAVRSSVDRYANLEVNYLLQRMEEFEGVTILTTNFDAAFDEAFRRRIKFAVTFPFPDAEARKRLWRSMFPTGVPVARDVRWDKLSGAFEMSGGHIKNAALRAAFLTAERKGRELSDDVIWEAARLEYLEMGKLVRE